MTEFVVTGWESDNGFRGGYLNKVEESLLHDFSTTDLRANSHIQSKITAWKKNYNDLYIILERSEGDNSLKGIGTKAWPCREDWKVIFGKDRANGETAEDMMEARRSRGVSDVDVASLGFNSEYNVTFDENSPEMSIGYNGASDHGEDIKTQSAFVPTSIPKRAAPKQKNSDDNDGLLQLLEKLHTQTNSCLDTLSGRIGYEIDIGKARQTVFEQLGGIPGLS